MTFDITPSPIPSAGPTTLSHEEIRKIEQMLRENKAATLRGDPPIHTVTQEMVRDAVMAIRQQRGTLDILSPTKKKAAGKRSGVEIDIDDIDI